MGQAVSTATFELHTGMGEEARRGRTITGSREAGKKVTGREFEEIGRASWAGAKDAKVTAGPFRGRTARGVSDDAPRDAPRDPRRGDPRRGDPRRGRPTRSVRYQRSGRGDQRSGRCDQRRNAQHEIGETDPLKRQTAKPERTLTGAATARQPFPTGPIGQDSRIGQDSCRLDQCWNQSLICDLRSISDLAWHFWRFGGFRPSASEPGR